MNTNTITSWLAAVCALAAINSVGPDPAATAAQGTRGTSLVGLSAPSRLAAIGAEQSGTIVAMPVTEGSRVVSGQVLVQLSSRLQELEVTRLEALVRSELDREKARANVRHTVDKLKRLRELSAREIASRADLDEAELEAQLANLSLGIVELERGQRENQLQQARQRLQERTLHSPFDGVVTQRFKQAGETVEQLLPVVEVMALDPLWIEFECPASDDVHFRLGDRVRVRPAVGNHQPRTAEIVHTSWKATRGSYSFLVRAALRNEDYSWRVGLKMLVEAEPDAGARTGDPAAPPAPPAGK